MAFQVLVNGALLLQTPDDKQAEQCYSRSVAQYPAHDVKLVEVKVLSNRPAQQPQTIH